MSRDIVSEVKIKGIDLDRVVTPARFKYYNVKVYILEIQKTEMPTENGFEPLYIVSTMLEIGNVRTRVFPIPCKNIDDYINKLKVEILNLKKMYYMLGEKILRQVVQGSSL